MLQMFFIILTVYPSSSISDLSGIDSLVKAMEIQVQQIKDRLRDEKEAIPKAKVLSFPSFYFIPSIYIYIL